MINRPIKFAVTGLVIALVAAQGTAQITKSGPGYLFRMKFAKGQTAKYTMDMKASMKNPQTGKTQNMTMNMPMTSKVLSVSAGVGNVESKVGPIKLLVDGKPMNLPSQPQTQTVKMDARGNIVGGTSSMQGVGTIGFPAKPISIGSSWTANTKAPGAMGGPPMDVKATYKFIGLENVGGRPSAKVNVTMAGAGQAKVSGGGTMWLATGDGSLVKTTMKMTIVMGTMTIPMTMNVVRK